jgi:hypothetical protein
MTTRLSTAHPSDPKSVLTAIEAVLATGKAVISGDDSSIIATVQEAIKSGRSETFYLSREQGQAVLRWYWTPGRIAETGIELVSQEEMARIESELHVKDIGDLYSNNIQCSCGAVYGAFEFIQQGIREHGIETVRAVLELKDTTSIIRVNPATWVICPQCNTMAISGHYYYWGRGRYGCCSGPQVVLTDL